jgi:hypothetical protein
MDHPQSFHDVVEHWKTKNRKPDGTYPSCSTENGRLELIAKCRHDATIQNTISRVVKTAVGVLRQQRKEEGKICGKVGDPSNAASKRGDQKFLANNPDYKEEYEKTYKRSSRRRHATMPYEQQRQPLFRIFSRATLMNYLPCHLPLTVSYCLH